MVRPTFLPLCPPCSLTRRPPPAPARARTPGPAQRDTHQQTSPAATAIQVMQQGWRCLVCTALLCREQHTHTR